MSEEFDIHYEQIRIIIYCQGDFVYGKTSALFLVKSNTSSKDSPNKKMTNGCKLENQNSRCSIPSRLSLMSSVP